MTLTDTHRTQTSRILFLLRSRPGEWVSLLDILDLKISQYSARILELRRSGLQIENRSEWVNGKRCSWFRLVENPLLRSHSPKISPIEPQLGLGINVESQARHWEHD